jgi:hypothetical protein
VTPFPTSSPSISALLDHVPSKSILFFIPVQPQLFSLASKQAQSCCLKQTMAESCFLVAFLSRAAELLL